MSAAGEFSGTTTAGSYRLVRPLDAEGEVFEARHDRLPGRFAVKLFEEVDARAFLRAVQQASALRHPGIVRVVDHGTQGSGGFLVMEWADGRSLASTLAAGGPLAPDAVARIVDGVALGLQAAHRQGLAHGHLAPGRVLVSGSGALNEDETPGAEHTKILGFGLGPPGARAGGAPITRVTPYAAPEQLAGVPGPLADQYALAALAYEALSGSAPDGDADRRKPPRSLREYDPTINVVIDDVVRRALSFDPRARWPDVHTFAARLREAVDSEGALEEKTRLAPLPLTVTKPDATPTPIELPPVIASVDVDLGTPAPARRELPARELQVPKLPVQGEISMNHPPARHPSFSGQSQMPGYFPGQFPGRAPAPPHYGIHPTPTFSFTDDPEPGPLYRPRRRRRSSGGFGLVLVVLAAGVGGYLSVERHWLERAEPLVARAKELVRSLRTLAPGASPEPAPLAPGPASAATASSAAATTAGAAAAAAPTTSPAPQAAPPEVVPIPSETTPERSVAARSSHHASSRSSSEASRHASPAHHHAEEAGRPARAERPERPARARPSRALSDEAATEEALLAPPSSGR
jgi:serine/threonine-protein kinase